MVINANTKIATILKENSKALEAIISIDSKFEKLRNPLLRKIMAGRTSLAMASKIGGININEFFEKLEPLGFEADRNTAAKLEEPKKCASFMKNVKKEDVIELDVRPFISSGSDPLNLIMQKLKTVKSGQVLNIINTFEPTPLILLLEKKGYQTFVDKIADNCIETYFYKPGEEIDDKPTAAATLDDFNEALNRFKNNLIKIDVRHLEMPQPMHKILESLETLEDGFALFVFHKRIPVYLLPELSDRGFEYRFKEIPEGGVHLLIFKA